MKQKIESRSQEAVHDFQSWFQREYLRRRKKNGAYSIRAFSNYLGLSSGTVSQLISGKRKPSVRFVEKLLDLLEASPKELAIIRTSLRKTENLEDHDVSYKLIAVDGFKLMAEWFHYAILELTSVRGFKYDHNWISNQLNISVTESRQAIARLLRLDLLREKDGILTKTNSFVTNGDDVTTSSAHKEFHRAILEKAIMAIDTVPLHEKDISSITMAIDESKISEAKKRITKFRREICQFLENGNQTRVYSVGIQLLPLSTGAKKKLGELK